MFKVEDGQISITRGDKAIFNLTIKDYSFMKGDIIHFRVYGKSELEKNPLIDKQVIVNEDADSIDIELTSEDTTIGTLTNKPVQYWYEVELNNNETVIGYDEEGPKIFIVYPEGRIRENDSSEE